MVSPTAPVAPTTAMTGGLFRIRFHDADLSSVPQHVIHQDQGHHGLDDGRGADAHTGVVPALGHDLDLVAVGIHETQPEYAGSRWA